MNFNICRISLSELTPGLEREIEDFSVEWKTTTPSWNAFSLITALRDKDIHLWIVRESSQAALLGLALVKKALDEAEILYLHVAKEKRRAGVGNALIGHLCHELIHQLAVTSIYLEVRPSNEPALKLYQHNGFNVVGRRPTYYHDGEDALVYARGPGAQWIHGVINASTLHNVLVAAMQIATPQMPAAKK